MTPLLLMQLSSAQIIVPDTVLGTRSGPILAATAPRSGPIVPATGGRGE